jgi:hypothetical protein
MTSPEKSLTGAGVLATEALNASDEEILDEIELPIETMYLIDKVVRMRTKRGPFGADHSELINLEMQEE